MKFDKDVF